MSSVLLPFFPFYVFPDGHTVVALFVTDVLIYISKLAFFRVSWLRCISFVCDGYAGGPANAADDYVVLAICVTFS